MSKIETVKERNVKYKWWYNMTIEDRLFLSRKHGITVNGRQPNERDVDFNCNIALICYNKEMLK